MDTTNGTNQDSAPIGGLAEANAYASLSKMLLADRPLSEVLEEVALLAKQVLPDTPEVSVTLLQGDHAETAAFTGAIAIELDERQYDQGFGPCLDAAASGERIKLVMSDPDNPYPDWCRLAQQQGVTHSMSVGLPAATPALGALNLYNPTGMPFSGDSERIARTFATLTGVVLAKAGLHQDLVHLAAQLEAAVRSRALIDQAKGIIMAENRCSGEDAFHVLVRGSQNLNIRLARLAEEMVGSVAQPEQVNGRTARTSA